jgi:protein-S-isoprenylcysteine O-methyltransferase Ste14
MKRRGARLEEEVSMMNDMEKTLSKVVVVVSFALFIYPIFLPLKVGTAWFYVGSLIYLLATIFGIKSCLDFATTPMDKPATSGVYRISRNPMYLGGFVMYVAIGIASASWIYILLAMMYIAVQYILVGTEERWCLETYGDTYREYMNRTPRWIGIPKSEKKDL